MRSYCVYCCFVTCFFSFNNIFEPCPPGPETLMRLCPLVLCFHSICSFSTVKLIMVHNNCLYNFPFPCQTKLCEGKGSLSYLLCYSHSKHKRSTWQVFKKINKHRDEWMPEEKMNKQQRKAEIPTNKLPPRVSLTLPPQ